MYKHKSLFVFDIETIPDTDSAYNLLGVKSDDIKVLRTELESYHLKITNGNNSFLRQPFHKVIALSYLHCNIKYTSDGKEEYELVSIKSGGNIDTDECGLVEGFFEHMNKNLPRLISFNGHTFDIPVLKYRAMKYGISSPGFYQTGDKWNNYTQKYSNDWHCDLLDCLSDYGSSARIKLSEVCSILDLPGKFGVDGSMVSTMYDDGDLKGIRDYCETDVLNTYLVYLRTMLHRSCITRESYFNAIDALLQYINSAKLKHFDEFYEAWKDSCKGNFYGIKT